MFPTVWYQVLDLNIYQLDILLLSFDVVLLLFKLLAYLDKYLWSLEFNYANSFLHGLCPVLFI